MASALAMAAWAIGGHRAESTADRPMVCTGCFKQGWQHVEMIRLALNRLAEL
jgi:hypothetical protein